MRSDLPPAATAGPFDELRETWDRMHGAFDRTARLQVAAAEPSLWPRKVRLRTAHEHVLPGPPGGYAAGLASFRSPEGAMQGMVAPVEDRLPLPPAPHPLLARWELPGLSLPLPGAVEYALGPGGLSAFLPPFAREVAVAVAAGSSPCQDVRLEGLEVTPATPLSLAPGAEAVFRIRVPAGGGEVQAWAGPRSLGRVEVTADPESAVLRCDLEVHPPELQSILTQPLTLRLRLVRVSGEGAVEASAHVPLQPSPLHVPLPLAAGEAASEATFTIRPDSLPRVEEGTLPILLLIRGEAARIHRLPFRRVRLRRSLPRADLRFSRYEPHPYRHLTVRRSDGAPVDVDLFMPANLAPHLEIRRLADGRFQFVGLEAPPAALDSEVLARDALTGLEERIPVRLERGPGEGSLPT